MSIPSHPIGVYRLPPTPGLVPINLPGYSDTLEPHCCSTNTVRSLRARTNPLIRVATSSVLPPCSD